MTPSSFARLVLLAAISGATFLFMRLSVSPFGPSRMIFGRLLLGALFLWLMAVLWGRRLELARYWRHYLILGLINALLPFLLTGYAVQMLSASLLSVLNATSPMWAALLGACWRRQRPPLKVLAGLLLGLAGVAVLAGVETLSLPAGGGLALTAGLLAALSFGLASVYTAHGPSPQPHANALGTLAAGSLLLAPLVWSAAPMAATPTAGNWLALLMLGILCSGIAYLMYFRLVAEIGPAATLTGTFLIPVFATLWGVLFLQESVGWHTLAGALLVLSGTAMVTGFSLRALQFKSAS
ncbi:DMT family transporter [Massilia sp. W12]|uniref:DMT family transporter n=1 Tax=Massilia sp. W12 TaxID=3126507 RepID=UPI0030D59D37